MSAWKCGPKTLSIVADVIKSEEFAVEYDKDNLFSYREPSDLVQKLEALNNENLNYLYGDNYGLEAKYEKIDVSPAQSVKTVCCYLYQSCEWCEDNNATLYNLLDKWAEDNRGKYVDEWFNLIWDYDEAL